MVTTPVSTADGTTSDRRQRQRVFLASTIGSAIEFYDFLIYSTAASLVFGKVFFAGVDPAIALIASFATLAVGYVIRPLGGIVFGHFGDRISRKAALIWTLMLMGVSTALIGVLPTSAAIGALAPILLIVLRVVQGLAVGGEWGGAVLMSVEHARPTGRGLLGSATQMGAAIGLLLSFGAFAALGALDQAAFLSWGWRLPFLGTLVLMGLGLWIRLKVAESPVQVAQQKAEAETTTRRRSPLVELVRSRPRVVLLSLGVDAGPFMAQAVATSLLVSYATTTLELPRQVLLNALMIGSAGMLIGIPFFAWLSDRIGRRPVYVAGAVLTGVQAFALFPMIGTKSTPIIILTFVLSLTILRSATVAPLGAMLAELFPTQSRYTGVSLAYQMAAVIGGGLGPLLAATFVAPGGPGPVGVATLIAGFCLLSVVCVFAIGETRKVDLHNA